VTVPVQALPHIKAIRVKSTPIELRVAAAERESSTQPPFGVGRKPVPALWAGTFILLEVKRIRNTNFRRLESDRLAEGTDAAIDCVVAGYP